MGNRPCWSNSRLSTVKTSSIFWRISTLTCLECLSIFSCPELELRYEDEVPDSQPVLKIVQCPKLVLKGKKGARSNSWCMEHVHFKYIAWYGIVGTSWAVSYIRYSITNFHYLWFKPFCSITLNRMPASQALMYTWF